MGRQDRIQISNHGWRGNAKRELSEEESTKRQPSLWSRALGKDTLTSATRKPVVVRLVRFKLAKRAGPTLKPCATTVCKGERPTKRNAL